MDSLFEYAEGQSSEGLTSAILAYLLMHDEQRAFLRLLMLRLLKKDFDADASLAEYEIKLEVSLGGIGRADIQIESEEYFILIENKFYASFSGGDQLIRYTDFLCKITNRKGILVLLCPKERGSYYLNEFKKQLGCPENSSEDLVEIINQAMKTKGIGFIWLPWETLLQDFACGNLIVDHLKNFITTRYLKDSTLTEGDLHMINQSSIPIILEKLWTAVDKVKDALGENFQVKRTTQSRVLYGFTIDEKWAQLFFGLYTTAWKEYSTPIVIQVREAWITKEYKDNAPLVLTILKNKGFKEHKELGYIYPINIQNPDSVGEIEAQVRSCLFDIRNSFTQHLNV